MIKFATLLTVFIIAIYLVGCAPPPPLEEVNQTEEVIDEGPKLSKTERDSIIKYRRSFANERWKNKDFDGACRHYEVIRQHDLEHKFNFYGKWSDCFNNLGLRDSARYVYEEGIKLFPDDDYLHNSLAIMYRNERRMDEAIVQQKEAIRVKPENKPYIADLATMYEAVENWDGAIEAYQRLLELDPDDANVINNVNNLIRTHRDPAEYLKSLGEVVAKFPDNHSRRFEYASALLNQGNNEEAAKQFEVYTQLSPNDVEGWRNLALTREKLGQYGTAVDALTKVVELKSESLSDIVAVGRGYLNMKKWVKSRTWAQKALAMDSNYGSAWLLMGDIYNKAGDERGGSSPKYDDKLVFVIAYGLYEKAVTADDPESRANGDRSMQILKSSLPTKSERFMKKSYNRPSETSYSWLNYKWPEVSYLDKYLKTLD